MKLIIKSLKILLLLAVISFIACSETFSETDEKIKNQVNISGGNMKHRKYMIRNKEGMYTTSEGLSKANSEMKNFKNSINQAQDTGISDISSLGPGPIYFTGWVKYFKYDTTARLGEQTPKTFFTNDQYYEQNRLFPGANLNMTTTDGLNILNQYIQTPYDYYVVLFKNYLNFVSARQIQLQKTIDVLNIENIRPIVEAPGFEETKDKNRTNLNGIQDFGNFAEGFCFKILVSRPKIESWVLCAATLDEKNKFMNLIKAEKIESQRDSGIVNGPGLLNKYGSVKTETLSSLLGGDTSKSKLPEDCQDSDSSSVKGGSADGYWIVLQNWSQCNVKCGGGNSTLQRMCVPPVRTGKACEGEALLTRQCNKDPCPGQDPTNIVFDKNGNKINNTLTLKPIVKILPFSCRPQRYSKCIIKEADLMLTQGSDVQNSQINPFASSSAKSTPKLQIPTRVVMNNKTITIFGGDSYDSAIVTFSISATTLKRENNHPDCFIFIENEKKKAELCPFGFETSGKQMVEEWDFDFNLFKHQCFKPRAGIIADSQIEADLAKKLEEKMKEAKKQLLQEQLDAVKVQAASLEEQKLDNDVKITNSVALQAITRELNLEEMIRKEEEAREKREEMEMMKNIEIEKQKNECMLKIIKEKEIESQYNLKAKEAQDKINAIKETATRQVLDKRNQLKDQIKKMRSQANRKRAALDAQMQTVRFGTAQMMGQVYKQGNIEKCKTAITTTANRNNYCTASFVEDFNNLANCKEGEDFCITCCDFEFGTMHMNERQNCYKQTCPIKTVSDASQGRWIWQNFIAR